MHEILKYWLKCNFMHFNCDQNLLLLKYFLSKIPIIHVSWGSGSEKEIAKFSTIFYTVRIVVQSIAGYLFYLYQRSGQASLKIQIHWYTIKVSDFHLLMLSQLENAFFHLTWNCFSTPNTFIPIATGSIEAEVMHAKRKSRKGLCLRCLVPPRSSFEQLTSGKHLCSEKSQWLKKSLEFSKIFFIKF